MSTLRSILLHIDASPRSVKRLALAHALAEQHEARVTALYASTPTALSLPFVMGQGAAEMLPMLQQLDIDYRDNAKALFDRAESTAAAPFAWTELSEAPVIPGVVRRALCTDLLILGQHDAADPLTVGRDVLVAWKPTRESAHAVSAAIPFLRRAQSVHLAIADDADAADTSAPDQAAALEDFLRLHGVKAPIERRATVPAGAPGEGLLSLAADIGADLLVMGCYGHSRTRELVLGGATRTVLQSMTLPVLLAH